MKIGMIGTGNMGTILAESFIESGAITPAQLTITNRTLKKAEKLQAEYPGIRVVATAKDVIKYADYIFICVKPLEIFPLLAELKDRFTSNHCLISITSPITIAQLESVISCSVARIIPSINNRALSGSSLVTFGKNCSSFQKETLLTLMQKISNPIEINEDITRVASDIASCGPAFFSYIAQRFIDAAVEETKISREEATVLSSEMLIGLGKLIEKGIYTLPALQEKVSVQGGVTGEGIRALEQEIGQLFNHLYQATHRKFDEDCEKVGEQFDTIAK